jgi:hypothetical protein
MSEQILDFLFLFALLALVSLAVVVTAWWPPKQLTGQLHTLSEIVASDVLFRSRYMASYRRHIKVTAASEKLAKDP